MKSVVLETILKLEEEEILRRYPHGVIEKKGRFSPCEEGQEPSKPLGELMDLKSDRLQKDIYLHKDSTRGYTTVPALAMQPDVGASPSKRELEDYAQENWQRFLAGLEGAPLSERVKVLEGQLRSSQMSSLQKRVAALERIARKKAA